MNVPLFVLDPDEALTNFNALVPGLAVILNGLSIAPPMVKLPPKEPSPFPLT